MQRYNVIAGVLLMLTAALTAYAILIGHAWGFVTMAVFAWPFTIAVVEQANLND